MKIIRLKKGDKVVESLTREVEEIESGIMFGLGALSQASLKIYDLKEKKYNIKKFNGDLEVGSFTAIIAKNPDGKTGIHPHIVISKDEFESYGGHLEEATVAATFEVFIIASDTKINRYFDQEIGLNLLNL